MGDHIICAAVDPDHFFDQEERMTPGSTVDICRACEAAIWLSPEGHDLVYVARDAEPICIPCADHLLNLEEEVRFAAPPKAPDWVRRYVERLNQTMKEQRP